ncbi:heat-inducible transcriptional repressor HrcA [Aerococcus mictus]|uniref:Heat-inducible transcription repressor HrcA n=1 Tax=Aerococcus mictus TaxID=2976810 RepID=A0A9Q4H453_9LACT|nr:heat-inducible transcriptional repressor HrcA [Aerococcus mictus]MCY3087312.1 heat-inducible transcriptional repressor HrcA [Aerococcus mictus]
MLSKRQIIVLKAIIDAYSQSEEPIGSKSILKLTGLEASSATIRNDMAKLEKLDLIKKMHSSSGRVPTEAGYRFYINYILPKNGGIIDSGLSEAKNEKVSEIFQSPYLALDEIVNRSTELLAELTNYVAISLGPDAYHYHLAGFRFVPVTSRQVMLVLVTEEGTVETQIYRLPDSVSMEALEDMANIINRDLIGLSLPSVLVRLKSNYMSYFDESIRRLLYEGSIIEDLLKKMDASRVFVKGKANLYNHLYQSDAYQQVENLNRLFANPNLLDTLIDPGDQGIQVKVGKDMQADGLNHLSIMATNFVGGNNDQQTISVAILGPENMSYLRMAQLFQGVRLQLNHYIDSYYKNDKEEG